MSTSSRFFNNTGDTYNIPDVFASKSSPDTATISQLDDLTDHAVHLYHTNPLAHGAVETVTLNTVGTGLKLQSKINYKYLGISEDEAIKKQEELEEIFNMLAGSTHLDIMGLRNFKQLQEIAYRTAKMTGGAIALYPKVKTDKNFKLKIKLLEAQHLCNKDNMQDTERLAGGVKVDGFGAVSHYHILKNHPNGYGKKQEWVVIPTKSGLKHNVVHLYEQKRAGQRRGVPYISAVLDVFRKLNDYSEAELDSALLNARFAGFVWNDTPPPPEMDELDEEADAPMPSMDIKKGNLIQLEQGWKVDFADPSRPNANFGGFMEAQIKMMCIGLNIPFELFMKHFTASYSASRGAIIEGKKYFYSQRHDLASIFCQPTYENVILELVLDGKIQLQGFLTDPLARLAWLGTEWIGDAQEELDPLKAVNASAKRMELGLSTGDREAKEMNGSSFKRNVDVATEETKLLEKSGLLERGKKPKDGGKK